MISVKILQNEKERLKVLKNYNILDTLSEEEYDAITKIPAGICDTPILLDQKTLKNLKTSIKI